MPVSIERDFAFLKKVLHNQWPSVAGNAALSRIKAEVERLREEVAERERAVRDLSVLYHDAKAELERLRVNTTSRLMEQQYQDEIRKLEAEVERLRAGMETQNESHAACCRLHEQTIERLRAVVEAARNIDQYTHYLLEGEDAAYEGSPIDKAVQALRQALEANR